MPSERATGFGVRDPGSIGADWHRPAVTAPRGLRRYLVVLGDRWPLVAAIIAIAVGVALGTWVTGDRAYHAEALMTVSPVATSDPLLAGIDVIRDTGSTRDVETLARLVTTVPVAQEAARRLGSEESPERLLERVEATPVGQSFLVSVRAEADDSRAAADLANAFAEATIRVRGRRFEMQVARIIARLDAQLADDAAGLSASARADLATRRAQLAALSGASDPSVGLQTAAFPPASASSPGLPLVAAAALVVGLGLALTAALLLDATESRIRRERQLLDEFAVPVLARIPDRSNAGGPPGIDDPASAEAEAYRGLARRLALLPPDGNVPRTVLFTSATAGAGTTTAAISTALALARAGHRVLLVDADVCDPELARRFEMQPSSGVVSVLTGHASLEEALVPVHEPSGRLELLLRTAGEESLPGQLVQGLGLRRLLGDAQARGTDFVIFDGAPLGGMGDVLPLAAAVDDVMIVVRLRRTPLAALRATADEAGRYGVMPRGFVIVSGAPGGPPWRA